MGIGIETENWKLKTEPEQASDVDFRTGARVFVLDGTNFEPPTPGWLTWFRQVVQEAA